MSSQTIIDSFLAARASLPLSISLVFAISLVWCWWRFVRRTDKPALFWKVVDLAWISASAVTLGYLALAIPGTPVLAEYEKTFEAARLYHDRAHQLAVRISLDYCLPGRFSDDQRTLASELLVTGCAVADNTTAAFVHLDRDRRFDGRQPLNSYGHSASSSLLAANLAEYEFAAKITELRRLCRSADQQVERLRVLRPKVSTYLRTDLSRAIWLHLFAVVLALRLAKSLSEIKVERRLAAAKEGTC